MKGAATNDKTDPKNSQFVPVYGIEVPLYSSTKYTKSTKFRVFRVFRGRKKIVFFRRTIDLFGNSIIVIPAEAGIQTNDVHTTSLDSGGSRNDGFRTSLIMKPI